MKRSPCICPEAFLWPDQPLDEVFAGFLDYGERYAMYLPAEGPLADVLRAVLLENQNLAGRVRTARAQLGLDQLAHLSPPTATLFEQTRALNRVQQNEMALKGDLLIENPRVRQRIYQLLYPLNGLGYYNDNRLRETLADRLTMYLEHTQEEAAALGPLFVQRTQHDLAPFALRHPSHWNRISKATVAYGEALALLPLLSQQLTYAYHLLSAHFRERHHEVRRYFSSRYFGATDKTEVMGYKHETVAPLHQRSTFNLADFPTAAQLLVDVKQGGPLRLARVETANAYPPVSALLVPATSPLTMPLADLPGHGPFVVLRNDNPHFVRYDACLS